MSALPNLLIKENSYGSQSLVMYGTEYKSPQKKSNWKALHSMGTFMDGVIWKGRVYNERFEKNQEEYDTKRINHLRFESI